MTARGMTNLYLQIPRKGWRNDGGPIPYRLRGRLIREGKSKTVITDNPLMRCRVGHWVVLTGGDLFVFSQAEIEHLYGARAR